MPFPLWSRDPWVWGQLILFLLIGFGLPYAAAQVPTESALADLLEPRSDWRFLGLVVMAAGVAIAAAAVRVMGDNLTPATTPRESGALVTHGIYRHVRHPIYLGVILVLWGLAWILSTWVMGLVAGGVSLVYFDRKAAVEERKLTARFPEFPAYRDRVPRLLPRLR
ncbi:MAG: isoprenylcysteine carboxylmethyltransferase family protein [Gemmatimonadota bacterium]|nr:isoprenylcysteine carboxylmethyltransferase family protein [Gemmatimonadota bacterium]